MKKYLISVVSIVMGVGLFTASAYVENTKVKDVSMPSETHHLEVKPESLEGYRIPYMNVTVEIFDQSSNQQRIVELHPMFGGNFHYAANVTLEPRTYLLRFHLDPPTFMRGHSRENQWLNPVEAEFSFDAGAQFEKSVKIGTKEIPDMKISFEAEHAEEMFILNGAGAEHAIGGEEVPNIGFRSQIQEFLPFEYLGDGQWFAVILSIILWTSLVYTIWSLIKKLRKTQ